MRILIADDDTVSRFLLDAVLKELGHEVVVSHDGMEAWKLFQQEYFPVVIVDWIMPLMDGSSLCRQIRAQKKEKYTYIIVLTVLEGEVSYLQGMDAGADDFLSKPLQKRQLAARLHVAERILNLQSEVKQLLTLLPICSYCKKIRDQKEYWQQLELYFRQHSTVQFSHTICPDCYEKIVKPELEQMKQQK
jgi:DNA-binding response OmpR family regulator